MPLLKRSGGNDILEKQTTPPTPPREDIPPPAYVPNANDDVQAGAPDITAGFANLNLNGAGDVPTPDQCIAHLKLLEAFHQLREDVALQDGLYGIKDEYASNVSSGGGDIERERAERLTQMREKRWAVFVSKAAWRFEVWWKKCIQPDAKPLTMGEIPKAFAGGPTGAAVPPVDQNNLPPLGK